MQAVKKGIKLNDENQNSSKQNKHSLTHLDESGRASMVDVANKDTTIRQAVASAIVVMKPETSQMIQHASGKKGEVLQVARIAGIMAAKKTDDLIPLCHGLALTKVQIDFDFESSTDLKVTATAKCVGQTGVEMEAMVAASIASLTVYDMCKAVDRSMEVRSVLLEEKLGGKSGHWIRNEV